jgi:hypothetical protein
VQLNQWSSIASLNKPRSRAAAAAHSDSVFVFGGISDVDGYLVEIEQYDTAADKWTVLQARLSVARQLIAAACLDDNVYLFGGQNENKLIEAGSTAECFSVKEKKIKTTEPVHKPAYGSVAASLVWTKNKVLASILVVNLNFTLQSSLKLKRNRELRSICKVEQISLVYRSFY